MTATPPPTLEWNGCDRATWDRYLSTAGRSSVEQSWCYGEAMAACHGQAIDRVIIRQDGTPVAMAQLFRRKALGVLSVARIARGPLLLAPGMTGDHTESILRTFRRAFSVRRGEILFWLPELVDTPHNQALMRSLGTRRMVTGLSSAWLDLSRDEADLRRSMTGSWRTALRNAEKTVPRLTVRDTGDDLHRNMADYDSFHRQKRFLGPSGRFVAAMAEAGKSTGDVLMLTADDGPHRIAGIVLIRHGVSATYFVSWTTDRGRAANAHNLLLWRGMETLRKAGVKWLDLGGLNTGPGAGVARFKLGLGPEVYTLAGTFL